MNTDRTVAPITILATLAVLAACEPDASPPTAHTESKVVLPLVPFAATYFGASWGSCTATRNIVGYAPATTGARFPLFIYLVGTLDNYASPVAMAILRDVASRGAVAVSVEYSNLIPHCGTLTENSKCVYDPLEASSAVAKLCARADVDCKLGIVTAGHSQGASTALLAKNWNTRVRAWWGLGVTSDTLPPQGGPGPQDGLASLTDAASDCVLKRNTAIPSSRMRAINGLNDMCYATSAHPCQGFGSQPEVQRITDATCASEAMTCLRADGSGWYVVANSAVQDGDADHGFFAFGNALDAGFAAPSSSPWSLAANASWLLSFTGGPLVPQRIACGAIGIVKGAFSKDDKFGASATTTTFSTTHAIEVSAANAAPMAVYQRQRGESWWRTLTYTMDEFAPNTRYTVRLHFAELWFTRSGARTFHVDLQGVRRETNLDVFAQAGGAFKALVKEYSAISDSRGAIVISLATGAADNPMISGIEVL